MAFIPKFRDAERRQCKAAIVIDGLSGKGKTGLALMIAHGLTGDWEKVFCVDTESNSMQLYRGVTLSDGTVVGPFKVGDLTADDGFKPSHYGMYREAAIEAGAQALVCDSISHMWQYKGGVLDMVSRFTKQNARTSNKYSAWNEPEIASEKAQIMEMIRHPRVHCINTSRVKEKMEFIMDDNGKTALRSLGEQQIIMPDFKYEPDLVLSMVSPGTPKGVAPVVRVTKSRYVPFEVDEEYTINASWIEQLRRYLDEGTSPEELLDIQRQEYIEGITRILDTSPSAKTIWEPLKDQNGVKDVPLKDIPLKTLKALFSSIAE